MPFEIECAPMEGVTDAVYRRVHSRFFPGVCRYYTPFISPTQNHRFTPREKRELAPENNPGLCLVPQLLGKNAADFLWAAEALAQLGYTEVNLNLGCPSGTVFAKGKGAGFLAHTDALHFFLDEVFADAPLGISVKTRLGVDHPEEFPALLELYNQYPLRRLIVHARTRQEMYRPGVHREMYAYAAEHTSILLSGNGDLFSAADVAAFRRDFPAVGSVMLGRGLITDPGLVSRCRGQSVSKEQLRQFHEALCREYPLVFGNRGSAMHRLKAIWQYMLGAFDGGEQYRKKLIKAKTWEEYRLLTREILDRLPLQEPI